MRPVGALLFGWLADRYGRRIPLIIDLIFYSVFEVLSGLAPTYGWFLLLRALYGIGMGGEWGVGASLAMEAVRRDGAACFPACCRRVMRSAICSRRPLLFRLSALRMARDVLSSAARPRS